MIDRTQRRPATARTPHESVEEALERVVLPRLAGRSSRELAGMLLAIMTNPEVYRRNSRGTQLYIGLARQEIRRRQLSHA